MQVETLKDVLGWTQQYHHHLSTCLEHCANENDSERSRLLLDYLAKHEQHLEALISALCDSASENALKTWCLEYLNKQPIVEHEQCDQPFAKMSTLEISQVIFKQHNEIIDLYRYLYAQAGAPSALDLISKLISLEEHEAMQMSQGANSLEDI